MTAASSFLRDAPIEHVIVPPQASELAARYDGLLAILTVICGAVLLLITVLIVVQAVRFRARGGGPRGYDRLRARHWWVEAAWTLMFQAILHQVSAKLSQLKVLLQR